MNTILVSYDLKTPGKDYSRLHAYLKSYSNWAKPLESLWILKTSKTATETRDLVKEYVDNNDKLLVIDITKDSAAWLKLPDEVAKWIKENI